MSPDGRFSRDEFLKNKGWGELYDYEIRKIVGAELLKQTTLERDINEATDYDLNYIVKDYILTGEDFRCNARMVRPQYHYCEPLSTFRCFAPSGLRVELHKILDGFGDWKFTGYATGKGLEIDPWWILDLHELRRLHAEYGDTIWSRMDVVNEQDSKRFHTLDPYRMFHEFRSDTFVVATSDAWPPARQELLAL